MIKLTNMKVKNTVVKSSKKLILAMSFMLLSVAAICQEGTYRIIDDANVANISEYTSAMNDANFDSYRYFDKNRQLTFESGVVIELLSVNTLQEKGIEVNESRASLYDPNRPKSQGVWKLLPNGYISQEFETYKKRK